MGKDDTMKYFIYGAIILFGIYITGPAGMGWHEFGTAPSPGQTTTTVTTGGDIWASAPALNEPVITFRAYNLYQPTTASTSEGVLVYKDGFREGNKSMGGGTLSSTKGQKVKAYFGFNDESGSVYTQKVELTTPDSPDVPLLGKVCTIDTTPTITFLDKYGQVVSATTNAWNIGSGEEYLGKVTIQASADQCYGNPNVGKDNIACFIANTTVYKSVVLDGQSPVSMPTTISGETSSTNSTWCYLWKVIADNEIYSGIVKATAKTGQDPATASAEGIGIVIDDIGLTLDADTDAEIIGYEDETGTALGAAISNSDVEIT